jgi:hypothetical protein
MLGAAGTAARRLVLNHDDHGLEARLLWAVRLTV